MLFEDDAVTRMSFGESVHKVHTYAFLRAMENMGVVHSADALIGELHSKRRNLAKILYERPAMAGPDALDWTMSVDQEPTFNPDCGFENRTGADRIEPVRRTQKSARLD